jgi:DNA (cytosine-5)-methyltransferase 1
MKTEQKPPLNVRACDLFAGVGGSSLGATQAGVSVVAAVDTWELAQKTYLDNFKGVTYYHHRCESLDPTDLLQDVGPIQLLLASPECTNHTCAKGSSERSERSRRTALQVGRFAAVLKPRWIVVENVIHMRRWHRYQEWIAQLLQLGYNARVQVLNAADFGVPQARRRLFVICDRKRIPPRIVASNRIKVRTAGAIINPNGKYPYSPLEVTGRAPDTLLRANRAIASLGSESPFLIVYYGTDGAGGWQRVDAPLRTVTTVDRFAYVKPAGSGYEMRMLQVPELKAAMGFPGSFKLDHGTRRDRIKLLGNAVCPAVMRAIIAQLMAADEEFKGFNGNGSR